MSKNERVVQALNPKWKVTGKTVFESGLTVRHMEEDKWNLKCTAIFFCCCSSCISFFSQR